MVNKISHVYRKVYVRGGSVAVTLPPEAGFKAGDLVAWRFEDSKLILSKAKITNGIVVSSGWSRND